MLLGRAGARVLLVDRSQYGADTLSTHALMRGGVLQLHRWGLLDAVRRAGTPPITKTRFHYGDDVAEIAIRPDGGFDALYAPRRTVLDPIVVDGARAAGVETAFGVRVTGVCRDDDGRVTGIHALDDGGDDLVVAANIVIGADGISSTVARLVAAPIEREANGASAFIYGYFEGLPIDAYDWHFRPGTSAGVIPTNDRQAVVFVGLPPSRFAVERQRGIDRVFDSVLREAAPDVATAIAASGVSPRLRSFPGTPGYLRRAGGPGWALVGDAGSLKDPLTAHGITAAFRDAELLTRSLLTTGDTIRFQRDRDLLARPFLDVSARLASYEWDLDEVRRLHLALKDISNRELRMLAGIGAPRARVRHWLDGGAAPPRERLSAAHG
jgi:2-polyprenyl-6-methoxyphenol hydroxylase-like FAD-dependent oxidoreductase